MFYLIAALMIGINIAPFMMPQLDIWHAQGIFVQISILILFSFSFILKPRFQEPKNIQLGILHLWVGLLTGYICFVAQVNHKYDTTHFFPYFNFLCLLILYKTITQYISSDDILRLLNIFRWVMIVTLGMCVLQAFGLAQFFEVFGKSNNTPASGVVGFIGNGTHLSGFLAMMIPIFLYFNRRLDILCLILTAIVLSLCGTIINDPSISGFLIFGVLLTIWIYKLNRNIFIIYSVSAIILVITLGAFVGQKTIINFISLSGRQAVYEVWWPSIKSFFITGAGLGTVNALYKETALPHMRHLHMEYFQFLLEIGFIGIVCVIALIKDFIYTQSKNKAMFHMKLIFSGFLISCLFNYPAHLWLSATYACIAYACFMVLKRGDDARIHTQTVT